MKGDDQPNNQKEKTTKNFENLKELKDLSFIENNKKIINRIKVTSINEMFKLLLIENKNSKKNIKLIIYAMDSHIYKKKENFFLIYWNI